MRPRSLILPGQRRQPKTELLARLADQSGWAEYIAGLRLPVLHTDATGRLLNLSWDACALFGATREGLLGRRLDTLSTLERPGTPGRGMEDAATAIATEEHLRLRIPASDGVTVVTDWMLLRLDSETGAQPTFFWLG